MGKTTHIEHHPLAPQSLSTSAIFGVCFGVMVMFGTATAIAYKCYKRQLAKNAQNRLSSAIKKGLKESNNGNLKKTSSARKVIMKSKATSPTYPSSGEHIGGSLAERGQSSGSGTSGGGGGPLPSQFDPGHVKAEYSIENEKDGATPEKDECMREKHEDDLKTQHLGTLHFSTEYDSQKNALLVTILQASELPPRDPSIGGCDPYIKLQLLPEKKHKCKTRVLRKTLNPVYDETFTFYGISYNQLAGITLHFVVLSFDRFSRDEIIGEVVYPLSSVDLSQKEVSLCKDITPRHLKVSPSSGDYWGRTDKDLEGMSEKSKYLYEAFGCKEDFEYENEKYDGAFEKFQNSPAAKVPYLGNIDFSIEHDSKKNALHVTILKASDLNPSVPGIAVCDPYIKLQLLPEKKYKRKTRILRKTLNPVYDETFTFYGVDYNQLEDIILHFVVLSFDKFSRDEIIGEVIYPLSNVDLSQKEISLCKDITARHLKFRTQGRGELLVSLSYQPAANRLTVVVLKARNLPKMDVTGLSDPYVKIYLLYNGQRIAKKKTHVKKRTLNPVFNESFLFDVPYNEGLHSISLEFLLLDFDRMTKNEVIGRLEIGSRTTGQELHHWNEVLNCPRKQTAEWHKLKE
ncbi:synaptotagmin-11 [Octopus bimaculoides]|nr:synaptotagmin-11 [Octopus bimaculoides]|eukprot:XP_014791402.1 PREDICTED: synaptotagmin-11-like [Octopus bimaculoides]